MKSDLAILRDEWFESLEGKDCLDLETLPLRMHRGEEFLRNRLERAFLAGAAANKKCKQQICADLGEHF